MTKETKSYKGDPGKYLVIGGGGREYVLAKTLRNSNRVRELLIAPGNGGTGKFGENVPVSAEDVDGIARIVKDLNIGNTIIGPEVPLCTGVVDLLSAYEYRAFGPTQIAAIIEGSKVWSAGFMKRHEIPSPESVDFSDPYSAKAFIREYFHKSNLQSRRWKGIVGKVDELAAGKGVELPKTEKEALAMVDRMMVEKVYGKRTGERILIQERLEGQEVSMMALTDGKTVIPLLPARDFKRANDGQTPEGSGPNTGGMASFAPVELSSDIQQFIYTNILQKTVDGMREEGREYKGVLYAGIMLTQDGPKVLEFNCRFGDPETQVVLPLLESDLAEIVDSVIVGDLKTEQVRFKNGAAAYVVVASGGYPGPYKKGEVIKGYQDVDGPDIRFIHAGTKLKKNGVLVTDGGRVGGVLALEQTIEDAFVKADSKIGEGKGVHFKDMHYRRKFF